MLLCPSSDVLAVEDDFAVVKLEQRDCAFACDLACEFSALGLIEDIRERVPPVASDHFRVMAGSPQRAVRVVARMADDWYWHGAPANKEFHALDCTYVLVFIYCSVCR